MGLWYSDPQPVQRAPRLPIAALTTGSQPPRTAVAGAIALACVLASTPTSGEPRLTQQQSNPKQIAPLRLVSGQQPPVTSFVTLPEQTALATWPREGEPRLTQQQAHPKKIAPLTLVYGQRPPIGAFVAPAELASLRASWEPAPPHPPARLKVTAGGVVVVTDQPRAPLAFIDTASPWWSPPALGEIAALISEQLTHGVSGEGFIQSTWTPAWTAPPRPVGIAPALLVYGQQPPPIASVTVPELALLRVAWEPIPLLPPQPAKLTGSGSAPVVEVVLVPASQLVPLASWDSPWRLPASVAIAPLVGGAVAIVGQRPATLGTMHGLQVWSLQDARAIAPLLSGVVASVPHAPAVPAGASASWLVVWARQPAPRPVAALLFVSVYPLVLAMNPTSVTLAASRTTVTLTDSRTSVTLASSATSVTFD